MVTNTVVTHNKENLLCNQQAERVRDRLNDFLDHITVLHKPRPLSLVSFDFYLNILPYDYILLPYIDYILTYNILEHLKMPFAAHQISSFF